MCEGESFWIWAVGSSNVQGTTKEELDHSRNEYKKHMLFCRMYVLGQPKIETNRRMVILENVACTTPFPVFCEANRKEMNILFHSEELWIQRRETYCWGRKVKMYMIKPELELDSLTPDLCSWHYLAVMLPSCSMQTVWIRWKLDVLSELLASLCKCLMVMT